MSRLRIHPAIGIMRVGNSKKYYLGPESYAGLPIKNNQGDETSYTGGIPLKADGTNQPIDANDIRDEEGALTRQAARFKIYYYPDESLTAWPSGGGQELVIGDQFEGSTVTDIIWTVHLANKKANCYGVDDTYGIDAYGKGNHPPLRNPGFGSLYPQSGETLQPKRIRQLTIDAGPRVVNQDQRHAQFSINESVQAYNVKTKEVSCYPNYPISFPEQHFDQLECIFSHGRDTVDYNAKIDTLGELSMTKEGYLIVNAAHGKAAAWLNNDDSTSPLTAAVDNNGWFDDIGDGPVHAVVVLEDGRHLNVEGAWVLASDPGYAPQTPNVVSLWDDMYETFVQSLALQPELYHDGIYSQTYYPSFSAQIEPFFKAAYLQRWNTALPEIGIKMHDKVGAITAEDSAENTLLGGLKVIRNPNNKEDWTTGYKMPLSLGDAGHSFLTPTYTQYFFLQQWDKGHISEQQDSSTQHFSTWSSPGEGEQLDINVLSNCLGGRFSPGIEMTFIVRDPTLYHQDWKTHGPFRIHAKPLDYEQATLSQPLLTAGWFPHAENPVAVEPGDISKFMALPWHTDYNTCAIHPTDPSTERQISTNTLYWSWPGQRPVQVHPVSNVEVIDGETMLGEQKFSVRGPGTATNDMSTAGIFQDYTDMVRHWHKIGIILQGVAIPDHPYLQDNWYLEVGSEFDDKSVKPWPFFKNKSS